MCCIETCHGWALCCRAHCRAFSDPAVSDHSRQCLGCHFQAGFEPNFGNDMSSIPPRIPPTPPPPPRRPSACPMFLPVMPGRTEHARFDKDFGQLEVLRHVTMPGFASESSSSADSFSLHAHSNFTGCASSGAGFSCHSALWPGLRGGLQQPCVSWTQPCMNTDAASLMPSASHPSADSRFLRNGGTRSSTRSRGATLEVVRNSQALPAGHHSEYESDVDVKEKSAFELMGCFCCQWLCAASV